MAMAWLYGGEDPFRLYHALDGDYRPLGDQEVGPVRPAYPARVKTFVYACAQWAREQEIDKVKASAGRGGL